MALRVLRTRFDSGESRADGTVPSRAELALDARRESGMALRVLRTRFDSGESTDHDRGQGPLHLGTDARVHRHRHEPQRCHQRRHENRSLPNEQPCGSASSPR
jgi:hypothetical protein